MIISMKRYIFSLFIEPADSAFFLKIPGLILFETTAALTALRQQGFADIFSAAVLELSLLFLSDSDLKHNIIPRRYIFVPAICRVISLTMTEHLPGVLSGIGAGAAIAFFVWLISQTAQRGFGGGDIRLFALAGLYLGLWHGLICILLSCVIGLVAAAAIHRTEFPFGPAISASIVICLIVFS
jgi:Flp pilus assembly protein protease CpaA